MKHIGIASVIWLALWSTACDSSLEIETPRRATHLFPGIAIDAKQHTVAVPYSKLAANEVFAGYGGTGGISSPWNYAIRLWEIRLDTTTAVPELWLALDLAHSTDEHKEGITGVRLRLEGIPCAGEFDFFASPYEQSGVELDIQVFSPVQNGYRLFRQQRSLAVALSFNRIPPYRSPQVQAVLRVHPPGVDNLSGTIQPQLQLNLDLRLEEYSG